MSAESSQKNDMNELDELYLFSHLEQKDRSEQPLDILTGRKSLSPIVSDSEQASINEEFVEKSTDAHNDSEKGISPIRWDRGIEADALRVDATENEFSKEEDDEKIQSNAIISETASEVNGGISAEIMDPDILTDYDQLFINTRYFLIKSNNFENVEIAKSKNAWSTPIGNESRLNRAYRESNNVILIFSVCESGKFQGFARLASQSDPRLRIDWVLPPRMSPDMLSSPFRLDWVTK